MARNPVIDDLDRCKIALQYIAEGQSTSLTVVLELLLEQLEDAIGQAAAQLRPVHVPGRRPAAGRVQRCVAGRAHAPPTLPADTRVLGPRRRRGGASVSPHRRRSRLRPRKRSAVRSCSSRAAPGPCCTPSPPSPARGPSWIPHMLRATCAVRPLKRGEGLAWVRLRLGLSETTWADAKRQEEKWSTGGANGGRVPPRLGRMRRACLWGRHAPLCSVRN